MSEISSNNKRIAKNTMMLYIRMLLSMVVSLYTSRVVLQTLGVEDYGVYSVVGGIVSVFSFLNSTMAAATSRFLTFEMGKGDKKRIKDCFSSALIIHILIALLVLILVETAGLWFLNNKLVIPENRINAAHWVLQFSILGMIVGFTQVPYNATIIAHEKMDVYAYVELIHVFLKLGIVYLLLIGNFDKLILYAFLTLVVGVITAMIYRIYCIKHYEESKFEPRLNKDITKELVSFSLYNVFANMGVIVNLQGTAFVINMFFGVVYNAAATVGTTVSSAITGFSSKVMTAFKPQITKSYAQNNISQFQSLLLLAMKSMLLIYSLIAIPTGFAIKEVLDIWLVDVPLYADIFCILLLISIFFDTIRYVLVIGIHATGVIKYASLITGILYMLNPFIIFVLFKMNLSPAYAYISIIFINIMLVILDIFILKYNEQRIDLKKIILTITNIILVMLFVITILYFVSQCKTGLYIIDILIIGSVSSATIIILGFYCVLNKPQREQIIKIIKNKVKIQSNK